MTKVLKESEILGYPLACKVALIIAIILEINLFKSQRAPIYDILTKIERNIAEITQVTHL